MANEMDCELRVKGQVEWNERKHFWNLLLNEKESEKNDFLKKEWENGELRSKTKEKKFH